MSTTPDENRRSALVPKFAGIFALVIGILDFSRFITPSLHHRINGHLSQVPGTVRNATVLSTILTGVLMILLADGLARRKARAWFITEVLLLVSLGLRIVLIRHSDLQSLFAIGPAILFILLLIFRKEFYARPAPGSRRETFKFFTITSVLAFAGAAGIVSIRLKELTELHMPFSLHSVLIYALPGFIGVSTDISNQQTAAADVAYYGLFALGLGVLLPTLYAILRSHKPEPAVSASQEIEMRALLELWGQDDSLGYFSLREDKLVVWSATRKACVPYRVVAGIALASGDPIGDREAWPGAIEAFILEAKAHGWIPAVAAASEAGAEVWIRETGMNALEIGDEAIVDVESFTLEGRAMRNVRQMVNRIIRQGYSTKVDRLGELSDHEVDELAQRATDWRIGKTERGYSMALGRVDANRDPNVVAIRAYKEGELAAFLTFVPWGVDGLSLDFMRRSPECDPGITELLICELIQHCPLIKISQVSLNFAAFRDALERGERIGAGPVSRINRSVLTFASRFVQIDSLYRFNAKFRPIWEPRYLVYNGGKELLRAGFAYIKAEGFI